MEGCYENLLNEENPRVVFGKEVQNQGVTPNINREEVKSVLKKIKNVKVTEPYKIPVEVWLSLRQDGFEMPWDLMQKMYSREKILRSWRYSVIVPIYKENFDIQDCFNYQGIKLMSHTMGKSDEQKD